MSTIGGMSDYLGNKLINHLIRNTSFPATSSSSLWLALYISNPGKADSGTEVTGGSYVRRSIFSGSAPFHVSGSHATNKYDISFDAATSSWGAVTHYGIRDAATSGNLLFYGVFSASFPAIDTGDVIRIPASYLDVYFSTYTNILQKMSGSVVDGMLNHVLNGVSYSSPGSSVYAALFYGFTLPTAYFGTEPPLHEYDVYGQLVYYQEVDTSASLGYARLAVGGTTYWAAPSAGSTSNSGSLVFSYATSGSWNTIYRIGLYDAATNGNLVFAGNPLSRKTVYSGDGYYIPVNGMQIYADTSTIY